MIAMRSSPLDNEVARRGKGSVIPLTERDEYGKSAEQMKILLLPVADGILID